ncbi:hypothetical protein BT96DRAFT_937972 [Gymnopus androsaceus JB14]|uniref:Uncharacterized protein n=1 Tax=Gymnopus androsaceus JB14 TaxID=1447944 RepID=A0A6A4HTE1_9AGAR|nr:hypothetical protein BT96DRAFT_937972 [Gymnopus androsaceus JB14]
MAKHMTITISDPVTGKNCWHFLSLLNRSQNTSFWSSSFDCSLARGTSLSEAEQTQYMSEIDDKASMLSASVILTVAQQKKLDDQMATLDSQASMHIILLEHLGMLKKESTPLPQQYEKYSVSVLALDEVWQVFNDLPAKIEEIIALIQFKFMVQDLMLQIHSTAITQYSVPLMA